MKRPSVYHDHPTTADAATGLVGVAARARTR
jgi:hypothetical protein